jgi:hypothetical protein
MSTGGGSSGSSKAVSTVSNAPWQPQQSHLTNMFTQAKGLTHNTDGSIKSAQYYPGQTYATMAPESAQALQMTADRANQGSDVTRNANTFASDVLGGKYLNQENPNFQAVASKAKDAVNANYGQYGRSNSGMHDAAVGREIGALAYGDYSNQLNLMNSVLGQSPQLAAADYADADRLNQVGAARQGEAQNILGADINKWNFQQQAPFDALKAYQDFISGSYGGTQQSVQPIYGTPGWQQGLGGGLAAAGTAANIAGMFMK